MPALSRLLLAAALTVPLSLPPLAPADARSLTGEEVEEVSDFVVGNVVFLLFHEFGHALISELSLPVLGREEDAVDALATVLLLPDEPSEETDRMVLDAMDGWFLTDDYMAGEGEDPVMWDEHALDLRRAYHLACLIYGSDPDGFADLADSVDLPEDRRETCVSDWERTQGGWWSLLDPHILPEGARRPEVRIVHGSPARGMEEIAAFLRDSRVLEVMGDEVLTLFRLPRPITVTASSCGEANAYWDPEAGRITICHELAAFYEHLIVEDILRRSP